LFLLVAFLALALFHSPGTSDTREWEAWTQHSLDLGLRRGYAEAHDVYPPFTLIVFHLSARIGALFGLGILPSIKASIWCFLVATGIVYWRWSGRAAWASLLMATLVLNSTALTYSDVYLAPFLLLGLRELQRERWRGGTLLLAIASMFKWQPIVVAPFALAHYLRDADGWRWRPAPRVRPLLEVVLPAVVVVAAVIGVMGVEVLKTLERARYWNPYWSGNALNLGWIVTHLLRVTGWLGAGGLVGGEATLLEMPSRALAAIPSPLFVLAYGMTFISFVRAPRSYESFLVHAQLGFLSYFVLATMVHENHLFVAVLLGAALAAERRRLTAEFLLWALALNINLLLFYGVDGQGLGFSRVVGIDSAVVFSFLVVGCYALQAFSCWRATALAGVGRRRRPASSGWA